MARRSTFSASCGLSKREIGKSELVKSPHIVRFQCRSRFKMRNCLRRSAHSIKQPSTREVRWSKLRIKAQSRRQLLQGCLGFAVPNQLSEIVIVRSDPEDASEMYCSSSLQPSC